MGDALPVPLESLTPRERERLRPVLERLAWERDVEAEYRTMLRHGTRSDRAVAILAVQESIAQNRSISSRTIERVIWPEGKRKNEREAGGLTAK
ncbi:MAG TPA: hypothetical protein VGB53_00375 [Rubricoccaceae bacterium]|jgi:hypothetical protein